ncbi:MAG: LysR family transcriptional regulator [Gammaproteobacteria bacterium]|nr:LysR family transcriptional regulator [Gammaproteobacteria bacterium]MBU1478333.1 LysR family transcriptional regulator [Gammaproteobacteria bacterium]MBU2003421.1 LysR family transcriptional regulator [Gammaproteobacteria bacterium]MBU2131469.1 LysR family transcriptional regulator [Gammaproteobacteria bacterium]MBU2185672.1 LysR family transcriptional regulator [Gammaproteobacteria bacterium]
MLPSISLDGLIVLDAIDRKGSFSAAAESLFRVPSALTYTVQKLESDLGTKLFERKGQRAELTLVGQLVLRQGREILSAASRLEEAVRQLETGWESSLTLAIDTVVPDLPLLQLIGEFTDLGKQVTVNISEESLGGGWDALYSGRADIAIGVTGELPKGQYHVVEIGELEFVFALNPAHPLAQHAGPIPTEALLQFPSIVVADSSTALAQRSSGLFDSRQVIRVPNMQTKIKAQQLGLGVGYIPKHLILDALTAGSLVACHVEMPRPPQAVFMAWRKDAQGKAQDWFTARLPQCDWQF